MCDEFIQFVRALYGESTAPIPLHAPVMGALEKARVGEAIDSTFVSSVGAFVTENAAFGVAQMERLPGLLASKRKVAAAYAQWCGAHGGAFVAEPAGTHSNYWLNALRLRNETERDAFLAATHQAGVMTRPLWTPMHRLPMYAACRRGVLPATERLASTLVNIPSSART